MSCRWCAEDLPAEVTVMMAMQVPTIPYLGLRTPVSSLTHFSACILAIYAVVYLWRVARGNLTSQLSLLVFSSSAVILYAASALYHAMLVPPGQLVAFQLLDQSAIYLLIAGTYTPTFVLLLQPSLRKDLLLALVWGLAFAGIACKWLLFGLPYWMTVTPYLILGWIGIFTFFEIRRAVGMRGLRWILYGGVCYSSGAVLDLLGWPTLWPGVFGPHEVFHLMTMLGTGCHFFFLVTYAVPYMAGGRRLTLPVAEASLAPAEFKPQ